MSQEPEPSIIDYARFHGLACDHLQVSPLQELGLTENLGSSLDDPPDLVHIDPTDFKLPQERLTLDADAASLLQSISELQKQPPVLTEEDLGINRHRVQRMKLELPLLRSDHEVDVIEFKSPIVPNLEDEFLPLESVNIEEDEGLEWPSHYYALPDDLTKKAKSEKMEASKDDLLFLQDALTFHLGCADGAEYGGFEVADLLYKKVNSPSFRVRNLVFTARYRETFRNQYHPHCCHSRPAPNHMYPHPRPAVLSSCQTLQVRQERKHVKLSV